MQSPEHLGIEHLEPLRRALINFLSAPISEFTYAQIIDGQPTSDVYAADHYFTEGLAVSDHEALCPGSLEKARAFRSDFNVLDLNFNPNVSTTNRQVTNFSQSDYINTDFTSISRNLATIYSVEAAAS